MQATLFSILKKAMCGAALAVALFVAIPAHAQYFSTAGLSYGKSKFLGNISGLQPGCTPVSPNTGCAVTDFIWPDFGFGQANPSFGAGPGAFYFAQYWGQVTPENGTKWGTVEATQGVFDWSHFNDIYNYAQYWGLDIKFHNFVWGSQLPAWFNNLNGQQQVTAVQTWIQQACTELNGGQNTSNGHQLLIDVVNEPINTPMPASFRNAIGPGRWDWVVWSFQQARTYCPSATLLLNEFNIINNANGNLDTYKNLAQTLMNQGLIDGIAMQCHQFSLDTLDPNTARQNLQSLDQLGLPVYISELDITGCDANGNNCSDATQNTRYQNLFPIFWTDPNVAGITMWGFIEGETWKNNTFLIHKDGTPRPAFNWLAGYVPNN